MLAKQCQAGAGGEPLALSGFLTMPTSGQRGSGKKPKKVHCMELLHGITLTARPVPVGLSHTILVILRC
jgi:hypothetical protein